MDYEKLHKCEQKPTDKVEPKFYEGDWIVYKNDICQIVKREEGCNKLVTVFGIEKELVNERNLSTARLWTIEDAKQGDILTDKQNCTCIFREIMTDDEEETFVDAYCGINIGNKFVTNGKGEIWTVPEDLFPATKEQRDLLFQKMKEAGYEWNADNKELKKIEHKPTWSEEDEKHYNSAIWHINNSIHNGSNGGESVTVNWLKSLRDRMKGE